MLLTIIEIVLTVKAWRNGYKAWALLPLGCVLLIAFMIGLSDPELAESNDLFSLIWLDILAIVALGFMNAQVKEPAELQEFEFEESKLEQEENFTELTYQPEQSKLPLNP